jgi:hypothetical protein
MATYAVNQTANPAPSDGTNPTRSKKDLKPLKGPEYTAAIRRLIEAVDDFIEDEVSPEREKAWKYYNGGTNLGAPPKGRSQVVMSEVRDTVECTVPSLMRIFLSTENIVEFIPENAEDVDEQVQKTAYVNYIFMRENNGWLLLHDFCKDALVAKTGCFKSWWQDEKEITEHEYAGLTPDEYQMLLSNPENEPIEEPEQDPFDGTLSCRIRRTTNKGKICIETVPPEEFVVDREAKSAEDAHIIGQRTERTIGELVQMGFDYDTVASLATDSTSETEMAQEREKRTQYTRDEHELSEVQVQMRTVEVWDINVRIDKDGDGLTEWRHVICAGRSAAVKILLDEPIDPCGIMYTPASPVMIPHTVIGRSQADLLFDLQDIVTHTVRQMLDNLTNVNNPRKEVVESQTNLVDLLDDRFRGIVRVRAPGMIRDLETPYIADKAMPVLDYFEHKQEMRTGISKASQGLDADALQSSTEMGVRKILGAAQQKTEMIAATLAHVGLVPLFQRIARLAAQYQDKQKIIRLTGKFVPMDPQSWNTNMDMTVNVGLGNGSSDEKLMALVNIATKQQEILKDLGPKNPIVKPEQYAYTLRKIVELSGFKDTSRYVNTDEEVASAIKAMEAASKNQPPDPEAMKAQAEIQRKQQESQLQAQIAQAKTQQSIQLAEMKAQNDQQIAEAKTLAMVSVEKWKTQQKEALERWKTEQELAVEKWKVQQQAELDRAEFVVETQLEREKMKAEVQSGQGDVVRRDKT